MRYIWWGPWLLPFLPPFACPYARQCHGNGLEIALGGGPAPRRPARPAGGRRPAAELGRGAAPGRLAAPRGLLVLLLPDDCPRLPRAGRLPGRLGGRAAGRRGDLPGLRRPPAGRPARRAPGGAG